MIVLPKDTNYIAAFLNFTCQLRCPYCINHHGGDLVKSRIMSGGDWIKALTSLPISDTLPATLQGGEPTIHPDFYEIVQEKVLWGKIDLLTNAMFDITRFKKEVDVNVFRRAAPYASIRISWHWGQNDHEVMERTSELLKSGYQVGIWAVDHPDYTEQIRKVQLDAWNLGIDFRLKEFLGPHGGIEYGTFKYPDAVNSSKLRYCECRTRELLIAPDGNVFRCHSDLYASRLPIGNVRSWPNPLVGQWVPCAVYGKCNSCDIKVKNNRFQEFGYSSVAVRDLSEPYKPNKEQVVEVVNTYGKADSKPAR